MSVVTLQFAICKWSDRTTATYFPINNPYSNDGKNTIFDAYGRQLGDPNFHIPRPATLIDVDETNDIKYFAFKDSSDSIIVYKKTNFSLDDGESSGSGSSSGSGYNRRIVSSNTDAQSGDWIIATANCTITLPTASSGSNVAVSLEGDATSVTILPASGNQIINGSKTYYSGLILDQDNDHVELLVNLDNWIVIDDESAAVQSDWSQTDSTKSDYIKNKPSILQSDWDQTDTTANDYIKNKPTIDTTACKPIPDGVNLYGTTLQFCQSLQESEEDAKGSIFSGTVWLTDTPPGGQSDLTVKVINKPSTSGGGTVYRLELYSTNTKERCWVSMYFNNYSDVSSGHMEYGTNSCPWFAMLMTPVYGKDYSSDFADAGELAKQYRGATQQYVDDAILQSDWNQTDTTAKDYIKNKPTISSNESFVITATPSETGSISGTFNKTDAEIRAAISAGKTIIVKLTSGNTVYTYGLSYVTDDGDTLTVGFSKNTSGTTAPADEILEYYSDSQGYNIHARESEMAFRYYIMPSASSTYSNLLVQYCGVTNDSYTEGHFYKVIESDGSYFWQEVSLCNGGSSSGNSVTYASTLPELSSATVGAPILLTSSYSTYKAGKIYMCAEENGTRVWKIVNIGFPVGDCTNLRCFKMTDSTSVRLKWEDPSDVVVDEVAIAAWKQTTVVRKVGSYPTDKSDGTVVVTSSVRNQYNSNAFIDTVPDASVTYYYGFFPETDEGNVTLSDGTSNRVVTSGVNFATLKDMTRSGELKDTIEEGTSFTVSSSAYGDLEVQIVGYNGVLPKALRYVASDNSTVYLYGTSRIVGSDVYSDEDLTTMLEDKVSAISGEFVIGNHSQNGRETVPNQITVGGKVYTCKAYSTVLWSRYVLPSSAGSTSMLGAQFDAPELQYAASEDETYQSSKTYYSFDGTSTYTALTAGTDYNNGDSIGSTVYEKNHDHRVNWGYNRWSQSGIRQFLNATTANNWWTKQNIFDKQPNIYNSTGFLYSLSSDFKSCLGKVLNKTAKNTVTDGGGFEYVEDTIFLPSYSEVFNVSLNSGYDGSQFTVCQTMTNDDRKKCTKASAESSSPSYQHYWLRSPGVGNATNVYTVHSSGGSNYGSAYNSRGVAFACAII